jgi:hypothetical protein
MLLLGATINLPPQTMIAFGAWIYGREELAMSFRARRRQNRGEI